MFGGERCLLSADDTPEEAVYFFLFVSFVLPKWLLEIAREGGTWGGVWAVQITHLR
jgi:hypothetical protein